MATAPPPFATKLPNVGTTIFTVMSKMAAEYGALNFGQGFPDFEVSRTLIDRVHFHMRQDRNQYSPMQGLPPLRELIAQKVNNSYGCQVTANEVVVTAGATEALFAAITALVREGDEGARELIAGAGPRLCPVEVEDPGVLLDVDRPEDLARIGPVTEAGARDR